MLSYSIEALKDFLHIRGLKTTGKKADLRALVYACTHLNVDVKPDEVEEDLQRSKQYAELLGACGLADQCWIHKQKVVGSSPVTVNVLCP